MHRGLDAAPEEYRNWEWRYLNAQSDDSLAVLRGHESWVLAVAFSPDGTRLASAWRDKTVRVWDPSTGEELLVLRGHSGIARSVAFSPDGTRLASASTDNTVRLWETVPYRVRFKERQAILAARPEAQRLVDRLRQQLHDPKSVANCLREHSPSLSEPARRAALNFVLRQASERQKKAVSMQPSAVNHEH